MAEPDAAASVERGGLCGEHPGVWLVRVPGKGWICPTAEKSRSGSRAEKVQDDRG